MADFQSRHPGETIDTAVDAALLLANGTGPSSLALPSTPEVGSSFAHQSVATGGAVRNQQAAATIDGAAFELDEHGILRFTGSVIVRNEITGAVQTGEFKGRVSRAGAAAPVLAFESVTWDGSETGQGTLTLGVTGNALTFAVASPNDSQYRLWMIELRGIEMRPVD